MNAVDPAEALRVPPGKQKYARVGRGWPRGGVGCTGCTGARAPPPSLPPPPGLPACGCPQRHVVYPFFPCARAPRGRTPRSHTRAGSSGGAPRPTLRITIKNDNLPNTITVTVEAEDHTLGALLRRCVGCEGATAT